MRFIQLLAFTYFSIISVLAADFENDFKTKLHSGIKEPSDIQIEVISLSRKTELFDAHSQFLKKYDYFKTAIEKRHCEPAQDKLNPTFQTSQSDDGLRTKVKPTDAEERVPMLSTSSADQLAFPSDEDPKVEEAERLRLTIEGMDLQVFKKVLYFIYQNEITFDGTFSIAQLVAAQGRYSIAELGPKILDHLKVTDYLVDCSPNEFADLLIASHQVKTQEKEQIQSLLLDRVIDRKVRRHSKDIKAILGSLKDHPELQEKVSQTLLESRASIMQRRLEYKITLKANEKALKEKAELQKTQERERAQEQIRKRKEEEKAAAEKQSQEKWVNDQVENIESSLYKQTKEFTGDNPNPEFRFMVRYSDENNQNENAVRARLQEKLKNQFLVEGKWVNFHNITWSKWEKFWWEKIKKPKLQPLLITITPIKAK